MESPPIIVRTNWLLMSEPRPMMTKGPVSQKLEASFLWNNNNRIKTFQFGFYTWTEPYCWEKSVW